MIGNWLKEIYSEIDSFYSEIMIEIMIGKYDGNKLIKQILTVILQWNW